MTLSEIMSAYRKEHDLSVREFAKKCNDMSNVRIGDIEKGYEHVSKVEIHPSIETIKNIAAGMGMSLEDLLERLYPDLISVTDLTEEQKSTIRSMVALLRKQG